MNGNGSLRHFSRKSRRTNLLFAYLLYEKIFCMNAVKPAESGRRRKCGCRNSANCRGHCLGSKIIRSLMLVGILVGLFLVTRHFLQPQ